MGAQPANQGGRDNSSVSLQCPMLTKTNYSTWCMRMKAILNVHNAWEAVEPGTTTNAKKVNVATALLFQSIPEDLILQVGNFDTVKEMWEAIKSRHQGAERVKEARLQTLMSEFENLKMKDPSTIDEFASKISGLSSQSASLGTVIEDVKLVKKFLNGLPRRFIHMVASLEQVVDLKTVTFDDIVGRLKAYEERIKEEDVHSENKVMFVKKESFEKCHDSYRNRGRGGFTRGRGKGRENGGRTQSSSSGVKENGSKKNDGNQRGKKDRSQLQCFRCDSYGHFAQYCPERRRKNHEVNMNETDDSDAAVYMHEIVYLNESRVIPKLYETKPRESDMWYLDNGASNHMTGKLSFFTDLDEKVTGKVRFGDDSRVDIKGKGSITFLSKDGDIRMLKNVYYIPSLKSNIISLGQATEIGCKVVMEDDHLIILDKARRLMMQVPRGKNRLYKIQLPTGDPTCLLTDLNDPTWLWHARYGHLHMDAIRKLSTKNMVSGIPKISYNTNLCNSCLIGKQTALPYPDKSKFRAQKPLELIHADLCGPITPCTMGGNRYIFLLVDDFSRYMWVYLLKTKDQAFEYFKRFKLKAETETKFKLGILRTDRGGEFTSKDFNNWCEENNVKRNLTTPYSPQQNGVVERRNRTVIGTVRCMLNSKKVPQIFWGEAVMHAIYLLNRSPTKSVLDKTPYEALNDRKPNVSHLRVFGCVGFVKVMSIGSKKLDDRSKPMIYFGSETGSKAYRMFDPDKKKICVSREVKFDEKQMWNWKKISNENESSEFVIEHEFNEQIEDFNEDSSPVTPTHSAQDTSPINSPSQTQSFVTQPNVENQNVVGSPLSGSGSNFQAGPSETHLRRSSRTHSIPPRFNDFFIEDGINREHNNGDLLLAMKDEPVNYNQAKKDCNWVNAMKSELEAIEKNNTWVLVEPPRSKVIGLKWIFKLKRDKNGEIVKHKARLVAKGYVQEQGIDFEEVFAPVARMETVRLIIALAAQLGWEIHHLDVKTAFLNGDLKETVFVTQPEGFVKKGHENKVYRLKKALYGLRQAPRAWNAKLNNTLKRLGFSRCLQEQAVYNKFVGNKIIIVGVYVDDLVVTGSNLELINEFKNQMEKEFEMSNLGLLSYYLGIEVTQTKTGVIIKQEAYAKKILEEAGMLDCNATTCPMDPGTKLTKDETGKQIDATAYRHIIGCLRYLLHTRPDISFAVGITSRYMQTPKESHLLAVKHLLRYIKGTVSHGIRYDRGGTRTILGYSDSSHATDQDDGRSTTGVIFYYNNAPITWCTQKQATVALSSCEAEFMAATAAACQSLWLQGLLSEVTGWKEEPVVIKVDNKSALDLSKNPVFHGRSKHINTRYHFIRECVEREQVKVEFVSGAEQRADILTKALPRIRFKEMKTLLGVEDFPNSVLKLGR